jgi:predicted GIY-YIG superfamily endonuclease
LRPEKNYYVYLVASAARVIYTGVTSAITARVSQHRHKRFEGFTADYNCYRLVYYERFLGRSPGHHPRKADQTLAARQKDCAGREH